MLISRDVPTQLEIGQGPGKRAYPMHLCPGASGSLRQRDSNSTEET